MLVKSFTVILSRMLVLTLHNCNAVSHSKLDDDDGNNDYDDSCDSGDDG